MKPFIIYISIILLGLNFASGQMGMQTKTKAQSLEDQFSAPYLSKHQLEGFESRVKQKVKDLIDYLNIVANPEYDQELRKHAWDLAIELFTDPHQSFAGEADLDKFLQTLLKSKEKISFSAEELTIEESLVDHFQRNAEFVPGELSFRFIQEKKGKQEETDTILPFLLVQVEKKFGKDRLMVWEVRLGGN